MNNTDGKIVVKAVIDPVAKVSESLVHSAQRGFISHRMMTDNILELEGQRLINQAIDVINSGLLLTDFGSAFAAI